MIQHVLDALRAAGIADGVVVVGHGAADIEAAVSWAGERIVTNPDPDRGLSSSLRIGMRPKCSTSSRYAVSSSIRLSVPAL